MSRRALFAGLALLSACGGGASGENTSSGSVKGVSFGEPMYAIYNVKGNPILQDKLTILITDDLRACDHLDYGSNPERPFIKDPDTGAHRPSMWMKTNDHTDILTDMRGVGDDLYANFDPGAPEGDECDESACDGRWVAASKGTLEINASSNPADTNGYAAGSYYLTFAGEQLTGEFKAFPCPGMKIEGCTMVGGTAFPALGLLALALLRRRRRSRSA